MQRNLPVNPRRIVVKLGTGILTTKNYSLNKPWIKKIISQIASLVEQGIQVILVTSGAIGAGMGLLGLSSRPKLLPKQQAAAAVGQSHLMRVYDTFFKHHHLLSAQILLTRDDLGNRNRYLNARNTLRTLLDSGVIPVINENDTVSVDEIKFGDNDRLSAMVAGLLSADLLIILSDVDGLIHSKKSVISVVERIVPDIERHATKGTSAAGTGGMVSKLEAAKMCTSSGVGCIVANGRTPKVLIRLLDGEDLGTLFLPREEQLVAKKRWIGFSSRVSGQILVDEGAKQALVLRRKSLLPKGIVKLHGNFAVGDTVGILDAENREFARGLSNYSSEELSRIKGKKSEKIKSILGYKYYDEVIHRDNLVIL